MTEDRTRLHQGTDLADRFDILDVMPHNYVCELKKCCGTVWKVRDSHRVGLATVLVNNDDVCEVALSRGRHECVHLIATSVDARSTGKDQAHLLCELFKSRAWVSVHRRGDAS